MQFSRLSFVTGAAVLLLLSGALTLLPFASAQSTVTVSIPLGAGTTKAAAPGYAPNATTVVIGVNNTVTWMNNDNALHTVTPSNVPSPGSWSVGSGDLAVGKSYTFTFTVPGTYNYTCSYHTWMSGSVVVKAAAATSTTTTPEFPIAALGAVLFVIMAALVLLAPRLRASGRQTSPLVP